MRTKADKLAKARDRFIEIVSKVLTDPHLAEMERRSQYDAGNDGFGSGGSTGHSSDVSRPTERTALALMEQRWVSDPQAKAIEIIVTETYAMRTSALRIDKAWSVIEHITDGRYGHQSSLQSCGACLRDDLVDRPKNGYCPACRSAWIRAGHPDRLAFEMQRRDDIASHQPA